MAKSHPAPIVLPTKHINVENLVRRYVEQEKYAVTGHARKRLDGREITIKEVRATIVSGKRESKKDEFTVQDEKGNVINRWSYAFRFQGLDRSLRVCVSIDETQIKPLLIVTAIEIK